MKKYLKIPVIITDDQLRNCDTEMENFEIEDKLSESTSTVLSNTSREVLSSPRKYAKKLTGFFKELINPSIIMGAVKDRDSLLRCRSLDTLTRNSEELVPSPGLAPKSVNDCLDVSRSSPAIHLISNMNNESNLKQIYNDKQIISLNENMPQEESTSKKDPTSTGHKMTESSTKLLFENDLADETPIESFKSFKDRISVKPVSKTIIKTPTTNTNKSINPNKSIKIPGDAPKAQAPTKSPFKGDVKDRFLVNSLKNSKDKIGGVKPASKTAIKNSNTSNKYSDKSIKKTSGTTKSISTLREETLITHTGKCGTKSNTIKSTVPSRASTAGTTIAKSYSSGAIKKNVSKSSKSLIVKSDNKLPHEHPGVTLREKTVPKSISTVNHYRNNQVSNVASNETFTLEPTNILDGVKRTITQKSPIVSYSRTSLKGLANIRTSKEFKSNISMHLDTSDTLNATSAYTENSFADGIVPEKSLATAMSLAIASSRSPISQKHNTSLVCKAINTTKLTVLTDSSIDKYTLKSAAISKDTTASKFRKISPTKTNTPSINRPRSQHTSSGADKLQPTGSGNVLPKNPSIRIVRPDNNRLPAPTKEMVSSNKAAPRSPTRTSCTSPRVLQKSKRPIDNNTSRTHTFINADLSIPLNISSKSLMARENVFTKNSPLTITATPTNLKGVFTTAKKSPVTVVRASNMHKNTPTEKGARNISYPYTNSPKTPDIPASTTGFRRSFTTTTPKTPGIKITGNNVVRLSKNDTTKTPVVTPGELINFNRVTPNIKLNGKFVTSQLNQEHNKTVTARPRQSTDLRSLSKATNLKGSPRNLIAKKSSKSQCSVVY